MESTESVPGPSGVQSQACPAGRDTCVDRHGCAPVKLYEHRNSNFRESLRFACHEIAYLNFFRPLKNVKKNPKNPSLACRSYKNQQVFRAGLRTTVCDPLPRPGPKWPQFPSSGRSHLSRHITIAGITILKFEPRIRPRRSFLGPAASPGPSRCVAGRGTCPPAAPGTPFAPSVSAPLGQADPNCLPVP